MLSCRELIEFLDDYLSGVQSAEVRAEFERHLAVCPYCVDYINTYRATIRLARAAMVDEDRPPEGVPEELIAAILAARTKNRS